MLLVYLFCWATHNCLKKKTNKQTRIQGDITEIPLNHPDGEVMFT
jgi:hypothetical protein